MSDQPKPARTIAEAAREEGARAGVEQTEKERTNTIQGDVDNTGAEVSANSTGEKLTLTGYLAKLWAGPWRVGARATWKL